MRIALITGSGGLIGSEAAQFFSQKFDLIVGIDNNQRAYFFGEDGSVSWNIDRLKKQLPNNNQINDDILKY
jgi:CDP-paratose 2-epimerase